MRILFLSDNFPPEGNAPATRLHEHATRWVRAGHEVTVITCAPNFPEGKLFPGYRNAWRQVEVLDGIRVVRVKTYITANEGFLKRTLDYVSFMLMGDADGLFERRPDVVVATSPQFFCAIAGWAVSVAKWRPFVFELRDLWPASITAVGAMKRGLVIRLLERIELFLYRRADAVVSVTESFREDLVARGIARDKIHVVINGVDLERYEPRPRDEALAREFGLAGKFVAGYMGTHGIAHALPKVLEAAERLRDRDDIAFFFAGSGAERARVEQIVAERELANVKLIPRQPKERMPALWSLCDLSRRAAARQPGVRDGDSVEDLRVDGHGRADPDEPAGRRGHRHRPPHRQRRVRAARRPGRNGRCRAHIGRRSRTHADAAPNRPRSSAAVLSRRACARHAAGARSGGTAALNPDAVPLREHRGRRPLPQMPAHTGVSEPVVFLWEGHWWPDG